MKIYTKTGDAGESSLFGGERVSKAHARLEAYGTVDELNACIGLVRAASPPSEVDRALGAVQETLFTLGADLATPDGPSSREVRRVSADDATSLERVIDTLDAALPALRHFILPGGTEAAARLHLARTVCRRAERAVVRLKQTEPVSDACVVYLNRLSDLLFVMSRAANKAAGVDEPQWIPPPAGT